MAIAASRAGSKPDWLVGTGTVMTWRDQPRERAEEARRILGGEHAADQHERSRIAILDLGEGLRDRRSRRRDCGRRRARCRRPAGASSTKRAGSQALHAGGPVGIDESPASMAPAASATPRPPQRRDGKAGIVDLVRAGKLRQRQVEEAVVVLVDEPPALGEGHVFGAVAEERRARRLGLELDHRQRVLVLRADDAGSAALQDAGLLRRDAGEVGRRGSRRGRG